MRTQTLVALAALLFALSIARGRADETKGDPKKSKATVCKSGSDQRTLDIQPRDGGGCKVVYTSGESEKTVGEAEHQVDFCSQLVEKMIKKFEGLGYKCN